MFIAASVTPAKASRQTPARLTGRMLRKISITLRSRAACKNSRASATKFLALPQLSAPIAKVCEYTTANRDGSLDFDHLIVNPFGHRGTGSRVKPSDREYRHWDQKNQRAGNPHDRSCCRLVIHHGDAP